MQLVLLTFVIGVLNLCIGYGLAVYLGHGPPALRDTWEVLQSSRPIAGISSGRVEATEAMVQGLEQESASLPETPAPAEPEEGSDRVVEPELSDLDALRRIVDQAASSLSGLAVRLEKSHEGQFGRTAWSFVGELHEVCNPYLQALTETTERILDDVDCSGRATALGDEVEQVALDQMAQLETTLSNLQHMDFDTGISTAMTRLTSEIENTLTIARRLQKALEGEPERQA